MKTKAVPDANLVDPFAVGCRQCKFADQKALASWLKGKFIPYCTYPSQTERNPDETCKSKRTIVPPPVRATDKRPA